MNATHSNTAWKERDFSSIREHYGATKQVVSSRWSVFLAIVYALAALPLFLLIPLLFLSKKSNIARGVFKVLHVGGIAVSFLSIFTISPNDTFSILSQFLLSLYFGLLTIIGFAYLKAEPGSPKTVQTNYSNGLLDHKVFGEAGNLSSARGKFSDVNIAQGEDGEKRTALMLEELLRIPGTRIFHGVAWPGSATADIDHIAINGNKLAFIDSKLWSQGLHVVNEEGNVLTFGIRGGKPVFRQVKITLAANAMLNYLRRVRVHGLKSYCWLAVHNTRGTFVKTDNTKNRSSRVSVLDAQTAVNDIGEWFASDVDGIVYPVLLEKVARILR